MAALVIKPGRTRHIRHRAFNGLDRGAEGTKNIPRLKHIKRWFDDRVSDLNGTGTGQTFTAANATEQLTITSHGHATGDGPFQVTNSGGALPTGLVAGTLYWLRVVDANTLRLYLTRVDAFNDTNVAAFSDDGTGTHTLTPSTVEDAFVELMRQRGRSPEEIQNATDIDNLV